MLSFMIALFAYPTVKVLNGLMFSKLEFYLVVLIVFSLSVAAWQAHKVFSQPLSYGLLTQRDVVLIGMWLVLAQLLRCGALETADLEWVLVFLAWITFALFGAMRIFLSPSNFLAYGEGFVTRPAIGVEPNFKLQEYFILFGVFYYALLGFRTRRIRYYLAALVLFPVTLGGSGRGIAVSVALTLFFFLYRIRGFWKATLAAAQFVVVISVLLVFAFASFANTFSARAKGFSDAFNAILTGSPTQDSSANARIFETLTALPYIQEHPFLGNGVISNQWQGGAQSALGGYFFVADIGFAGILFTYGAIGLVLYLWQYYLARKAAANVPYSRQGPFLDATKAFLLYSAIYSLESGICVWNASVTLFFVTVLYESTAQPHNSKLSYGWTGDPCAPQRPALSA